MFDADLFGNKSVPENFQTDDDDSIDASQKGLLGQHLVSCAILKRGYQCSTSSEGLPHDLIIHIGNRHISVQVKSGNLPHQKNGWNVPYRFGNGNYRNGKQRSPMAGYVGKVDILAFVALDKSIILYELPENQVTCLRAIPKEEFTEAKSQATWDYVVKTLRLDGEEEELDHSYALSFGI